MLKTLLRVSLLFLLASLFLRNHAIAAEAASSSIRLLAFDRVGDDMDVEITDSDGTVLTKKPVSLPTQQLSPAENISARSLVFRSTAASKKILGKVTLPATGNEFILVFLPAPTTATEPYHVDAVSMPSSSFGSGDYAFLNYSGHAVGCKIDGKNLLFPHGKATVYEAMKSGKSDGNRSIVCYQQTDGKWDNTPFFSSRLIVQTGVRNLILICLDPRTGEIDFRGIADFLSK